MTKRGPIVQRDRDLPGTYTDHVSASTAVDQLIEQAKQDGRNVIYIIRTIHQGEQDMENEAWTDKQGDVWRLGDDGLMHTHETAPFPREYVEKKWGPLRPTRTIGQVQS